MAVNFNERNTIADEIVRLVQTNAGTAVTPPETMAIIGAAAAKLIVQAQRQEGAEPPQALVGRVTGALNAQLALENASVYRPAKPLNGRFGMPDGDE